MRGALNAILKNKEKCSNGVITASAGNHAQGVAFSAKLIGVPAVIVMPVHTPLVKINNTKAYGAEIVLHGETYDDAATMAEILADERGLYLIHPFNNIDVIAGQGTIAIEILKDIEKIDNIIIPVGGGGLASGVAAYIKETNNSAKIIGVQSEAVNGMTASIRKRRIVRATGASFIAEGISVKTPGDITFEICSKYLDDIITVSENMIAGKGNDMFKPNENISRTEALTIMSKGLSCPMDETKANEILSKYKDGSQVPCWARECVAKAIDNGALKNERNQDYIRPNDKTTRAEASAMLQNIRVAGGYDKSTKTASQDLGGKTFMERETRVTIPTLELSMNDIINAKHANVGEQFSATTLNEITINGQTFPCGSTVRGKVTEVTRPSKNEQGSLKLSFNEIINCDGCKAQLPQQILTARVERQKEINGLLRLVQMPFTWTGSLIGTAGRTIGGAAIGISNAAEALLDQTGVGTSELLSGKFKAAGRSYQDGLKTVVKAPVDLTRTALSGTMGLFQTTGDEIAYLVDPTGNPISKVNPKEKVTIAFGQ